MRKIYFVKDLEYLERNDLLKRIGFDFIPATKLKNDFEEIGYFVLVDASEEKMKEIEKEMPKLKSVDEETAKLVIEKIEREREKETEGLAGLLD